MSNVPAVPESFRAARVLKLFGVTYAKGDAVPAEAVARMPRAESILSRRWLVPDPDPNQGRTLAHRPQPTPLSQGARARAIKSKEHTDGHH